MEDDNKDNEYSGDVDKEIEAEYEEDEKRKYPPFILLFLFTTVGVLFALGLSFSTIKFLDNNETINSIFSNIFDNSDDINKENYIITYAENTGGYQGGINMTNQFPISDSQGKQLTGKDYEYDFSLLIGSKTVGAYYEITAVPTAQTLDASFVKLYLLKNDQEVPFSLNANQKVKVYTDYKKSDSKNQDEIEGVVIYSDYITEDDVKRNNGRIDFKLKMWISEDAIVNESFSDKTFSVKVNTYAAFLNR